MEHRLTDLPGASHPLALSQQQPHQQQHHEQQQQQQTIPSGCPFTNTASTTSASCSSAAPSSSAFAASYANAQQTVQQTTAATATATPSRRPPHHPLASASYPADRHFHSTTAAAAAAINTSCSTDTEKTITQLEVQVEEQRLLRLQDAKQVEEKAAKIKEWVTNKLRELEHQNQVLREQNVKCNQQLQLLRNHFVAQSGGSSSATATLRHAAEHHHHQPKRHSTTAASTTATTLRYSYSLDGAVPATLEAALSQTSLEQQPPLLSLPAHLPELPASNPQQRNQLPPQTTPKKQPHHQQHHQHRRIHSMEAHELARDLAAAVDGLQLAPLLSATASSSSSAAVAPPAGLDTSGSDTVHDYAEIYTPVREMAPPGWHLHQHQPQTNAATSSSSSASLGKGAADSAADPMGKRRPPTPPLHRFPSWEAKIYQVAKDGLAAGDADVDADADAGDADVAVVAATTAPTTTTLLRQHAAAAAAENAINVDNPPVSSALPYDMTTRVERTASGGYSEINVPVYATVKGVS